MRFEADNVIMPKEELLDLMTKPCNYCKFAPGRCSEPNGCQKGISDFLDLIFF